MSGVKLKEGEEMDLISREWLKTAIHNFFYGLTHTPTEEDIQAYIDAAPSVNPQEKTGHNGCDDCKYETYPDNYYPCCDCKNNYVDKWQMKEGE